MKVLCLKIPFIRRWIVLPTFQILDDQEVEVLKILRDAGIRFKREEREGGDR